MAVPAAITASVTRISPSVRFALIANLVISGLKCKPSATISEESPYLPVNWSQNPLPRTILKHDFEQEVPRIPSFTLTVARDNLSFSLDIHATRVDDSTNPRL
jgi:hypothetical protein